MKPSKCRLLSSPFAHRFFWSGLTFLRVRADIGFAAVTRTKRSIG